jgi:hypothetical protein
MIFVLILIISQYYITPTSSYTNTDLKSIIDYVLFNRDPFDIYFLIMTQKPNRINPTRDELNKYSNSNILMKEYQQYLLDKPYLNNNTRLFVYFGTN